jgi:hypothetical protein
LMDAALADSRAPLSRCYVYDAQENTLVLEKITPVESLSVHLHGAGNTVLLDTMYKHLLQLDYVSTHKLTGKSVNFTLYVGTEGTLRGVPVQICYQPNWWFQVVLNLRPEKTATSGATVASR